MTPDDKPKTELPYDVRDESDAFTTRHIGANSLTDANAALAEDVEQHGVAFREHRCDQHSGEPCGVGLDLIITQPKMEEIGDSIVAVSSIPVVAILPLAMGMLSILHRQLNRPEEEE